MISSAASNISKNLESWQRGVTIGIPVYNEEPFIEATVRSAASQCEVAIISDNCSTDRSSDICLELAREYSNVIFVQQTTNIGALNNFKFVLNEAQTPYFMWLGGHDLHPSGYVKKLRERLDEDDSSVLAYGAAKHIDRSGNTTSHYDYFFSDSLTNEQPSIRLNAIIKYLFDCSLIYGLFRTAALKKSWVDANFLGGDHVLLAKASIAGKFLYEPTINLIRLDPHLHDTPASQLERISGLKHQDGQRLTLRDMQKSQNELVVQLSKQMSMRGLFFRLNSRFWLVNRFGPFGETWWKRIFEKVLRKTGRIAIKCRKIIQYFSGKNFHQHSEEKI
jgi:glycosyltransferase involved in cell wall biosynthesis